MYALNSESLTCARLLILLLHSNPVIVLLDYKARHLNFVWELLKLESAAADGITMDGMTLSFHKAQSRIVHPWLEDPDAELSHGSSFRDRIFVSTQSMRKLLWDFAGSFSLTSQ